jgi:hypothetical protein
MLTFALQTMIDRKFEPLVKRLMMKYLGEMEEEDLIMFVLEHLKDHKGPQKLVEGLEPVRWLSLSLLLLMLFVGPGGGGYRAHYQRLATNNIRKHGLWRRLAHGKGARRLTGSNWRFDAALHGGAGALCSIGYPFLLRYMWFL